MHIAIAISIACFVFVFLKTRIDRKYRNKDTVYGDPFTFSDQKLFDVIHGWKNEPYDKLIGILAEIKRRELNQKVDHEDSL